MSNWIEAKKESLSLSEDKKELHIYIDDDYSGAVYVSVQIKQILELLGIKNAVDNPVDSPTQPDTMSR